MTPIEVVVPVLGILLALIPVAGLTLVLTVRLGLKPFMTSLAEALKESGFGSGSQELSAQVLLLQEEVEALAREVRALRSAREFDRELLAGRNGPAGSEG